MDQRRLIADAVIPAAPKDYNKIPHVLRSIDRYLPDVHTVHVITPDKMKATYSGRLEVVSHADSEVLDFDRSRFAWRPNWVYQQFLKLFQNVTESDWFIVLDADILFNRVISLFEFGRPIMLLGRDQMHPPYFAFNQKVIGYGKIYPYSFLSECTLYSKAMIREMLETSGYETVGEFLEWAAQIIGPDCCPAESELYGSYVFKKHPELYKVRHLRSSMQGRYGGHIWTEAEITALIDEMSKRDDVDIYTMHTWEGKP